MLVTIFKNIREVNTPYFRPVQMVLNRIRDGRNKELIRKIRTQYFKAEKQDLKKQLPSICFSGTFTKRDDRSLDQHSGLICLDFDGYATKKELLEDKERMCNDRYTYSVFVSPSDFGLKVLVKIPADADRHVDYFNALKEYYANDHFDTTSKNLSRVCYESYDPQIFVNENSSVWDQVIEREPEQLHVNTAATIRLRDENKIVDRLLRWWEKKYPMVEGHRNENMYIIAQAFNEFGIAKSLAKYILSRYQQQDFPEREIAATIESAYKRVEVHNTKFYEDEEAVAEVRAQVKRGASKKEIVAHLGASEMSDIAIDTLISRLDEEAQRYVFWTKGDSGRVRINHVKFKEFLENSGFYKYCPENSNSYVFVKVTNNLIDHTSEEEIKDFVLKYLLDLEDVSVYNYFADNTRFFSESFLTLLGTINVHMIRDTRNQAFLYYRNCAVRVTKKKIETIDYVDLGGYVWKEQVIDRVYRECDRQGDYQKFIRNICGNDDGRVETMESTIGFLLHGYKSPSFCPAVILNDEVITDNPEGGTGKGLFMQGIKQMKKVDIIDGKHFDFTRSFPYQTVSVDTQVIVFDDVKKHFNFEKLFSVITEGLTLEKKNKDAIKIPYERTPKIAITTNYAIKGTGNSFERRKWEVELHAYYHKYFTPEDEFGRRMFGGADSGDGWDDDEYCRFDNYMLNCLKGYLNTGLVESDFVNLKVRKLSAQTSHEFIEWCGLVTGDDERSNIPVNARARMPELYEEFTSAYPDYGQRGRMAVSRQRFTKWVQSYGEYIMGKRPPIERDPIGRYVIIKTADAPDDWHE